ncbi:MAG: hypothetical protein WDW38_002947 [Sanguina aurantia]
MRSSYTGLSPAICEKYVSPPFSPTAPPAPAVIGRSHISAMTSGKNYTLFAGSADPTAWAFKTWANAEMACRNNMVNGHLASFTSDDEWSDVSSLATFAYTHQSNTTVPFNSTVLLWVGYNNLRTRGNTFTDGSATTYITSTTSTNCSDSACYAVVATDGVVSKTLQQIDCDTSTLAFICVGSVVPVAYPPSPPLPPSPPPPFPPGKALLLQDFAVSFPAKTAALAQGNSSQALAFQLALTTGFATFFDLPVAQVLFNGAKLVPAPTTMDFVSVSAPKRRSAAETLLQPSPWADDAAADALVLLLETLSGDRCLGVMHVATRDQGAAAAVPLEQQDQAVLLDNTDSTDVARRRSLASAFVTQISITTISTKVNRGNTD